MKYLKKRSQALYRVVTRKARSFYRTTKNHLNGLDAPSKYSNIVAKLNKKASSLILLSACTVAVVFVCATLLALRLSEIMIFLISMPLTGLWLGLQVAREIAQSALHSPAKIAKPFWAMIKSHTPSELTNSMQAVSHTLKANSNLIVVKTQSVISRTSQSIRSSYKKVIDKIMPVTKLHITVASNGEVLLDIQPLTSNLKQLISPQPKPEKLSTGIEFLINEARSGHISMQRLNRLLQLYTIQKNSPVQARMRTQAERLARTNAPFTETTVPRSSI